ncbi:GPI transamidase component PIG-T [Irpex rosettiformis]|uniref:GPI transamidase component PIG-T n=1 Tax=Irpex rosettiformis TaxID=378272 RepID=A0ACB8UGP7_9APHY|nr:GPI transamidase component PIG-T [Irpex rosettiformis]
MFSALIYSFLFLSAHVFSIHAQEFFQEQLTLRPHRDGTVLGHFAFTTLLKSATPREPETIRIEDTSQHYTLFPLALGQVLREYAITELHLSLNAGKWSYDRWGYPEEDGVGTGAELWAWMAEGPGASVDERWRGLRSNLAGLFCASLGSMDEQRTTSPSLTFLPEGDLPGPSTPYQLRHGTLPSENVCTENLTPFLKLLPCKSLSGIASLLNPHRLFDADWHGMGIHVRYVENAGVEVRLTFQGVFDPVRYSTDGKRDWSLHSIFDRTIQKTCPVARHSKIRLISTTDAVDVSPAPNTFNAAFSVYDVNTVSKPLDISMQWSNESHFEYPLSLDSPPPTHISVRRTLKGTEQSRGQLAIVIENHQDKQIKASYLETMPWLLQFHLNSIQVKWNSAPRDDLMSIVSYIPPVPHSRPTLLQSVLTLPPNGTMDLTIDVTKPFLRYTEHPPDAQRGWDLPPAVFRPLIIANDSNLRRLPRIYTPILLVDLATPDFSMPYNVIIMSCTLIALIFGSVFNLLTRKFVLTKIPNEPPQ